MNRYQQLNVGDWKLVLHLPPSYETSGRCYPVAYVQDGDELFGGCLNYLDHLYLSGQLAEVILIGIEPHSRNDEYTPWPAAALVDSFPAFAGRGHAYIDEVADVIKPYIDHHYRTKRQAEETAIIGGSLGDSSPSSRVAGDRIHSDGSVCYRPPSGMKGCSISSGSMTVLRLLSVCICLLEIKKGFIKRRGSVIWWSIPRRPTNCGLIRAWAQLG
ncbi:alpha/beta hydrolase-fold protein [Paenibacillus sp. D2_2]|uniref:alpha/beta hydrolase n=1 Tax=Paenibacillus sp. D2_2 TaxID=3073092 RepID=UPI002816807B|nr:alpha/beta hydrolase-fold protein [Paenibacillus sp. D2_2]WMT39953.1 alpha/beta hydrolase-fold protein [Paenibacillus sp. D2_2]